jgi:MFS family permease
MSLWAALSKPFWGYTIDKFDPKKLACLGFTVAGIGFLVVAFASQMPDQPTVRYPIEFWKFRGELPLILLLGCTLIGIGFGGQIPLQETIWGSFFGRRYLGAVRSVGMPFSIIFGAVAVPGAAYWAEAQGSLDAPFIATAICWFVGAVLVLFIPKPSKNIEKPESNAYTVNPNINTLESGDTNSESILPEDESHISISSPTHLSRLSERNHKHKNYMRTKD